MNDEMQLCDLPTLADHLEAEAMLTPISRVWAIALMQSAARVLRTEHERRMADPNIPTWEN